MFCNVNSGGVLLFVVVVLSASHKFASSFSIRPLLRRARAVKAPSPMEKVTDVASRFNVDSERLDAIRAATLVAADRTEQQSSKQSISFVGTKTVSTPPVPRPYDVDTLNDFFAEPSHRNLLFLNNEATPMPGPNRAQQMIWYREAMLGGASPDDYEDFRTGNLVSAGTNQVIQIKANLNLPGVKVVSTNSIGAKLLLRNHGQYPEYHFTVLDSQLTPEGSPPLVWLFNQLIKYRDTTSSFTRVRVTDADTTNTGREVVFVTEARLETRLKIPSSAIRLLGVNVDKLERQGSDAVRKMLEKELEPALVSFRKSYLVWTRTRRHSTQLVE